MSDHFLMVKPTFKISGLYYTYSCLRVCRLHVFSSKGFHTRIRFNLMVAFNFCLLVGGMNSATSTKASSLTISRGMDFV